MADMTEDKVRKIVREETADIRAELFKQGVLAEDTNDKLRVVLETLSENLKVKRKVDTHEERLDDIEAEQNLLKSTVALHSRQLKAA